MAEEKKSVADILSAGGGLHFSDFTGQVLTFISIEHLKGGIGPNGYGKITCVTQEGEEVVISNGGTAYFQLKGLEEAGYLPIDLQVREFDGQFGKKGYALDEVVEV